MEKLYFLQPLLKLSVSHYSVEIIVYADLVLCKYFILLLINNINIENSSAAYYFPWKPL